MKNLVAIIFILVAINHSNSQEFNQNIVKLDALTKEFNHQRYFKSLNTPLEGTLNINVENGNLGYMFEFGKVSVGQNTVNYTLNYTNSLNTKAFSYFLRNPLDDIEFLNSWHYFANSKPAWIVGINGFAVQVFKNSSHYYIDTNLIDQENCNLSKDTTFMNYMVEGYDFSNRMYQLCLSNRGGTIAGYGGGLSTRKTKDIIKILKSDGSVLELENSRYHSGTTYSNNDSALFVGTYFPVGINQKGYAFVEYNDDLLFSYFGNTFFNKHNTIKQSAYNSQEYKPRKLTYYQGDGLKYIFHEDIAPWGEKDYTQISSPWGNIGSSVSPYLMFAGPTIFYLVRIESENGIVASLQYYDKEKKDNRGDLGRKNFKSLLVGHMAETFTMIEGSNYNYNVRALDKIFKINTGNKIKYGNGDFISEFRYITSLEHPNGTFSQFNYENYLRKYNNTGFPKQGCDSIIVKNRRLVSISEQTKKYEIDYAGPEEEYFNLLNVDNSISINPFINNVVGEYNIYERSGGDTYNKTYEKIKNVTLVYDGNTDYSGILNSNTRYTTEITTDEITEQEYYNFYHFSQINDIQRRISSSLDQSKSMPLSYSWMNKHSEAVADLEDYEKWGNATEYFYKFSVWIDSVNSGNGLPFYTILKDKEIKYKTLEDNTHLKVGEQRFAYKFGQPYHNFDNIYSASSDSLQVYNYKETGLNLALSLILLLLSILQQMIQSSLMLITMKI